MTLSNAAWGAAEHMVSASAAEIGVELAALLSGEIKVTTLRLVDPVVALEIGGDGRANWVFGDGTGPQGGSSGQTPGEFQNISLPMILPIAEISRFTLFSEELYPIRPIRQSLPANSPRPAPISMS